MHIKDEMQALEKNSVTIEEAAESYMKIHLTSESSLNLFFMPEDDTLSSRKICEYINNNYPTCRAAVLEGLNLFVVFEYCKEVKAIH